MNAPPRRPERHEATLRRLELLITMRLDGLLYGDHQGLLLASGSEPAEAREYRVGDDVRHMDWNLTARTAVPHVRDTIAERELEAWLVVDRSASMEFGTAQWEKRELALCAVAAFALLNNRQGNRTGAVLLGAAGGDGTRIVPARCGRPAALALMSVLAAGNRVFPDAPAAGGSVGGRAAQPPGRIDLAAGLTAVDRLLRRRGLVAVISDFLDPGNSAAWPAALRRLGQRHQVVAVEVRDPREDVLPPVGLLTLVDPETGARLEVPTNNRKLRDRFQQAAAEQRASVSRSIRAAGARHLVLSTDRDWLLDIVAAVARWKRCP